MIIVCFTDSVEAENCALIGYTLLKSYHRPDLSLYAPRTRVIGFLLGFLILEGGTDKFSQNFGKELPLLAA
jgi:hypothetical protein